MNLCGDLGERRELRAEGERMEEVGDGKRGKYQGERERNGVREGIVKHLSDHKLLPNSQQYAILSLHWV